MRLSKWVEYSVVCDRCGKVARDMDKGKGYAWDNRPEIVQDQAKREGWKYIRNKNYCPQCARGMNNG